MAVRPVLAGLIVAATVLPASADSTDLTGLTCGLEGSSDATGMITSDPYAAAGEVTAGPLVAPGAVAVRVQCTAIAEFDRGWTWTTDVLDATSAGEVAAFAGFAAYYAPYVGNGDLRLCTRVTVTRPTGATVWEHDIDGDASNGVQCPVAVEGEATVAFAGQHTVVPSLIG